MGEGGPAPHPTPPSCAVPACISLTFLERKPYCVGEGIVEAVRRHGNINEVEEDRGVVCT